MKVLGFLLGFFLCFQPSFSLLQIKKRDLNSSTALFIHHPFSLLQTREKEREKGLEILCHLKTKTISLIKLARAENIPPTLWLSFTGGFLARPSLPFLFTSSSFLSATFITVIVMLNSMVMNDLFDIETDRINHPTRPLLTGELTMREAQIFSLLLVFISEFLNFRYLPKELHGITHGALLHTLLYTPVFKRIPLVKNVACASLVSFAIFFGATSTPQEFTPSGVDSWNEETRCLLNTAIRFIFGGSLFNEVLLDMKDMEGDKQNHIWTLPVLLGKSISWNLVNILLQWNIFGNTFFLMKTMGRGQGIIFFVLSLPLFHSLQKIRKANYDARILKQSVKDTNIPLLVILGFLSTLSWFRLGRKSIQHLIRTIH